MKISLILVLILYSLNSTAQTCEKQLEALRNEGHKLAESNNELRKANDALRRLFIFSRQDKVLEDKVRNLDQRLSAARKDSEYQHRLLRDEITRVRNLRKDSTKTVRSLIKIHIEIDSAGKRLARKDASIKQLASLLQEKNDSIRQLRDQLADYRRLVDELDEADKDRIYINSKLVVFANKSTPFGQTIFTVHYARSDTTFSSNVIPASAKEQAQVARFVKLVSKYTDRVKIHLVVGSRVNDNKFRNSREEDLKDYMMTFPERGSPFNLTKINFAKSNMLNTSSYDIQVQVVRK